MKKPPQTPHEAMGRMYQGESFEYKACIIYYDEGYALKGESPFRFKRNDGKLCNTGPVYWSFNHVKEWKPAYTLEDALREGKECNCMVWDEDEEKAVPRLLNNYIDGDGYPYISKSGAPWIHARLMTKDDLTEL